MNLTRLCANPRAKGRSCSQLKLITRPRGRERQSVKAQTAFLTRRSAGAACRRPFLSPSSPPNQGQILNFPTSCRNFHHFNALCFSSWTSVNVYLSQLSHVIFCRQIFLFVDKFLHQPQGSLISSSPALARSSRATDCDLHVNHALIFLSPVCSAAGNKPARRL